MQTSLDVLRTLRREGYNQKEIDYLFNSILFNLTRGGLRCIERLKLN